MAKQVEAVEVVEVVGVKDMSLKEMMEKEVEENKSVVNGSGGGKKEELLKFLREGISSVRELGREMKISEKNVGSLLCYVKKDGIVVKEFMSGGSKVYKGINEEKSLLRIKSLESGVGRWVKGGWEFKIDGVWRFVSN
jgi:predicted HTH transcriptional regulator